MAQPSSAVVRFLRAADCHGVYLAGITRMDRNLPPLPRSKVRRGDVLRLFGKPADVARAARLLGEAEIPSNVTDFVYLGGGLVIGILIGMVPVPIAGATLSLGSAGALLSGLGFGWLRARRPTFGRFPPAATQILKDLGLAVFIASIGLTSAPSVLALLETRGWELPIAAIILSLVPTLASVYVGRYLLHMRARHTCAARSPVSRPARRRSRRPKPSPATPFRSLATPSPTRSRTCCCRYWGRSLSRYLVPSMRLLWCHNQTRGREDRSSLVQQRVLRGSRASVALDIPHRSGSRPRYYVWISLEPYQGTDRAIPTLPNTPNVEHSQLQGSPFCSSLLCNASSWSLR